jgi:triacylglycerol lipase
MIARALLALMVVQAALFASLGAWLLPPAWVCWPVLTLCATAGVIFVRAAIVAGSFVVAWRYRTPRVPICEIGPLQSVALCVRETLAQILVVAVLLPFAKWFVPRDEPPHAFVRGTPVLLVHGLYCSAAVWYTMAKRLRAAGIAPVYSVTLEPSGTDIDHLAKQLAARIDAVCAVADAPRLTLITHSMGGLVARAYLRQHGPARVARLVTLGAPHHGSRLAYFSFGQAVRQMRPGSVWLALLNRTEAAASPVPVVSIYTAHDNFVVPQASAALGNAENVQFAGMGHVELLFRREVFERVLAEVRAPSAAL